MRFGNREWAYPITLAAVEGFGLFRKSSRKLVRVTCLTKSKVTEIVDSRDD